MAAQLRIAAVLLRNTGRRRAPFALCLSGELWTYLADINKQAQTRLELIVEQMKAAEGVTEHMKQHNQMEWVRAMNSIRNRAEEIILREMIYEEDDV